MSLKVVVVDDAKYMRTIIKNNLASYTEEDVDIVGEAENGEQALELIESLKPDLITLDLNMKVSLGGYEVARELNLMAHPPKIIVITGEVNQTKLNRVKSLGIPILKKPVNPTALHKLMTETLSQTKKDSNQEAEKQESISVKDEKVENNSFLSELKRQKKKQEDIQSTFFEAVLGSSLDDEPDETDDGHSVPTKDINHPMVEEEEPPHETNSPTKEDAVQSITKDISNMSDEELLNALSKSIPEDSNNIEEELWKDSLEKEAYKIAEKMECLDLLPSLTEKEPSKKIENVEPIKIEKLDSKEEGLSLEDAMNLELERANIGEGFIPAYARLDGTDHSESEPSQEEDVYSDYGNIYESLMQAHEDDSEEMEEEYLSSDTETMDTEVSSDIPYEQPYEPSEEKYQMDEPIPEMFSEDYQSDLPNDVQEDVPEEEDEETSKNSNPLNLLYQLRDEVTSKEHEEDEDEDEDFDIPLSFGSSSNSNQRNIEHTDIKYSSEKEEPTPKGVVIPQVTTKEYAEDFQAKDLFAPQEEEDKPSKGGFFNIFRRKDK